MLVYHANDVGDAPYEIIEVLLTVKYLTIFVFLYLTVVYLENFG